MKPRKATINENLLSLEKKKDMEPVIVEESFEVPVEKVWNAISDIDTMKHWYFDNIDQFKPEVGSKSKFVIHSGERTFTHLWEVTEVVPNKLLAYSWRYLEYPGDSELRFLLTEENGRVKLTVTSTFLEEFPADIPEFKRERCEAGWTFIIKERLKAFLK